MLPDPDTQPSCLGEECVNLPVPIDVALELRSPVIRVGLWIRRVIGAAVPEAPIDEDGDTSAPKDEIGSSPDRFQGSSGDPISKALAVEYAAKREFRGRVARSVSLHDTAPGWCRGPTVKA